MAPNKKGNRITENNNPFFEIREKFTECDPRLRERRDRERKLLANVKEMLPVLERTLREVNDVWCYEDGIYRFYHHSNKVFTRFQPQTERIVDMLCALNPDRDLNKMFVQIVCEGTGKDFKRGEINTPEGWMRECRPVVEAFLHARFFLEMAVKYGRKLDDAPLTLPFGWAAFLYLYDMR